MDNDKPTKDYSSNWVTAYLYYAEPWDKFLVYGIKPFIERTMASGIAKKYFFIRYWEKSPHIRLRFLVNNFKEVEIMRKKMSDYFQRYFKKYPSKYPDSFQQPKNNPPLRNTIVFTSYEPELQRYGGKLGIDISETQFWHSSIAAIEIISQNYKNWDFGNAFLAAIQLHLSFAYASGMSRKKALLFFQQVEKGMKISATHFFQGKNLKEIELVFNKKYKTNQKQFFKYHSEMWDLLEQEDVVENPYLINWKKAISECTQSLGKLLKHDQRYINKIYGSYFHMTNNRLGIIGLDEVYLSFVMSKSMLK